MQINKLKILMILLTTTLMFMPITSVEAQMRIGGIEVLGLKGTNVGIGGIDYNTTAKILRFVIFQNPHTTVNLGLGVIEVAFVKEHAPPETLEMINAYVMIDDKEYDVVDMVKNFTFIKDAVITDWQEGWVKNCSFLQGYIHLREDKTIDNEVSNDGYVLLGNIVFPEGEMPQNNPYPASFEPSNENILEENSTVASTTKNVAVNVNYNPSSVIENKQILLIGSFSFLACSIIIFVIIYVRKKR